MGVNGATTSRGWEREAVMLTDQSRSLNRWEKRIQTKIEEKERRKSKGGRTEG